MKLKMPHRYANTYRAEHSRSRTKHRYIIPRLSGERKEENERNYGNAPDFA